MEVNQRALIDSKIFMPICFGSNDQKFSLDIQERILVSRPFRRRLNRANPAKSSESSFRTQTMQEYELFCFYRPWADV